jgi:hypothetical protein
MLFFQGHSTRIEKIRLRCLSDALLDALALWLPYSRFNGEPAFSFWSFKWRYGNGRHEMGRKSLTSARELPARVSNGTSDVQWKNITLNETDVATIVEGASNLPAIADALALLLLGNGDFTLKYDALKQEYAAFVISVGNPIDGGRIGISARASTGLLCASAVFYKVSVWFSEPDRFVAGGQNMGVR